MTQSSHAARDANLMEALRNLNDPELACSEWTNNADRTEEAKKFPKVNSAIDLSPMNGTFKDETPRLVKRPSLTSYQRLSTTMMEQGFQPNLRN